jgi:D-sedoheptulose 7-phosphate isomerase
MNMNGIKLLDDLILRYPVLSKNKNEILAAVQAMGMAFAAGRKLLIAGNGGSAADAEHIAGELMKSFVIRGRKVDSSVVSALSARYGAEGRALASKLEGALPAIPLTGFTSLSTAFANDADAQVSFAQQVYGLGKKGDIFLAVSTSGNSKNLINALMVAEAKGLVSIGLTGRGGGLFNQYCQFIIHAPADETFKIQELHLPIYHTACLMLEAEFFGADT